MARADPRGAVWRKPDANLRADEQEHHMRRRLEASQHKMTKPCDLTATVNDAAVQGQFMFLSGEICITSDRQITSEAPGRPSLGMQDPSPCMSERDGADSAGRGNPPGD